MGFLKRLPWVKIGTAVLSGVGVSIGGAASGANAEMATGLGMEWVEPLIGVLEALIVFLGVFVATGDGKKVKK